MIPYEGDGDLLLKMRLVALLSATESAGLSPIQGNRLHLLAYMTNLLAQVWDVPAFDGKLLKMRDGPYYPALQDALDQLLGIGVVDVKNISFEETSDGKIRPNGDYFLRREISGPLLASILEWEDERRSFEYIQEVAFAISALSDADMDKADDQDATYSDPGIDYGNVIDFAEWQNKNFSANAANLLQVVIPDNVHVSAGEKIHFYIRHLGERIHNVE